MPYKAGKRTAAPIHPGTIIKSILDDNRISGRAAAEAIGYSANGAAKILRGETPVTPEFAALIGAYIGNGGAIWLAQQADYDIFHAEKELASRIAKIKPIAKL
jgi:addiction module HigA family antidote